MEKFQQQFEKSTALGQADCNKIPGSQLDPVEPDAAEVETAALDPVEPDAVEAETAELDPAETDADEVQAAEPAQHQQERSVLPRRLPEDFGADGSENGLAAIGQEALRRRNERLDSLPPGAFRQEAVGRRG